MSAISSSCCDAVSAAFSGGMPACDDSVGGSGVSESSSRRPSVTVVCDCVASVVGVTWGISRRWRAMWDKASALEGNTYWQAGQWRAVIGCIGAVGCCVRLPLGQDPRLMDSMTCVHAALFVEKVDWHSGH